MFHSRRSKTQFGNIQRSFKLCAQLVAAQIDAQIAEHRPNHAGEPTALRKRAQMIKKERLTVKPGNLRAYNNGKELYI